MDDRLERELSRLLRTAQAERIPSVSAAVIHRGEIIWAEAAGLADAESGAAATTGHRYQVGSITKTFTAAAIMQLRDAGELALDDRLGEHVSQAARPDLTIRRMLSHLSGIQRESAGDVWETLHFPTDEELLSGLADAEQVLAPGERWHYSNLAFSLLGEIVARRTGMPYERYVEERLLRPLGLDDTSFGHEDPAARGYFVEPYFDAVRAQPVLELIGSAAAAGGLWSTASDLCRWAAFIAEPLESVLAARSVEEMATMHAMVDARRWTLGWGLGLGLRRDGERILAGHGGSMPGFLSGFVVSREERTGAAVLTSSLAGADPEALAIRLTAKTIELRSTEPEPWLPAEPPPAEIAPMLGRWWSEGSEWVFRWRKDRLQAEPAVPGDDDQPAVFEREGADLFRAVSGSEQGELLRVVRDDAGEVLKLYWATYPFTRTPEAHGASR